MQSYLLFTAAFLVSIVTPGPDVVVVASKASSAGSAGRCLALILGIAAGKLLLLLAALTGLSALASALGSLFIVIKFAGAGYLAYLGVKLWRRNPGTATALPDLKSGAMREAGLGLAMSLGNPVAILFYAALLPNVIDVQDATLRTAGILIAIVLLSTLVVYMAYAALAAQLAGLFRSSGAQRRVNRASGAAMVGAAVLVAAR